MVQNNSKKIILITGATSGIGEATAKILSENYNLILCGRRENRLLEIQQTLSNKTEILTLNFDISNRNDVHDSINSIPDEWKHIDVLINNAGNAHGLDFIDEGEVDDWDKMIDINVKGLLYISKEILKIRKEFRSTALVRNIYSEVLNIIQPIVIYKLKKNKDKKNRKHLEDALLTSIAGISAAMKNTG